MSAGNASSNDSALGGRLAVWIATGLGIGFATPAPGTVGGLWGLLLVPAIHRAPQLWWQAAIIAGLVVVAAGVCGLAARALGADSDPQPIVLDEIVALPIVFLGVPALSWQALVVGYLLFRLCDIAKPGLAHDAEKLPGGWGIVADDVVAAAIAWTALRLLIWLEATTGLAWLSPA